MLSTGSNNQLQIIDPSIEQTDIPLQINTVEPGCNSNIIVGPPTNPTALHNNLAGLQGGSLTERYHITADMSAALTNANAPSGSNVFVTTSQLDGATFTNAGGDLSGVYPNPTVAKLNGQLPAYYLNYNNLSNLPTLDFLSIANPTFTGLLSGGNIALSSTQYILYNGDSDTNWRMGYNLGAYTLQNISTPLTIVTGTGSTDGFAIGGASGTSFFEIKGSNTNAWFRGQLTAANLSGTNTGDQNLAPYALLAGATFTGNISASNLSGSNTGDQNLTPYALLAGATFTGAISATNLSGSNTGDQNLTPYALLAGATFTGAISATNLRGTNTGDQDLSTYATISALNALIPSVSGQSGKFLSTNGSILEWETISSPDLSGYAQLSGATFTGTISATNLSGSNTGDQDLSAYQTTLTFSNGLTNTAGIVTFGGSLTSDTTLALSTHMLQFNTDPSQSTRSNLIFDGNGVTIESTATASGNYSAVEVGSGSAASINYVQFTGGNTSVLASPSGITVTDSLNLRGAVYAADYSTNFVPLSLVTKLFTDATYASKSTTLAGYGITDAYPLTGNPSSFLTSINSSMIDTALGYTPANDSLVLHKSEYIASLHAIFGQTGSASGVATSTNTGGQDGSYRIAGWINLLSVSSGGAVQLQATFTDEHSVVQTVIFFQQGSTTANITTVQFAPFPTMDFRLLAGATVSINAVWNGLGSVLYDVSGVIQQLE